MPTTPRRTPSPRGTTPVPETPAKRKLVGIEQAASSPRTAPGRKKRRDDHTAVGGADTEAEVLNYLGRFRATGEPASGEQALVVLLRGVASGRHGNGELRQFIIAYGAVRTFAGPLLALVRVRVRVGVRARARVRVRPLRVRPLNP